MANFFFNLAYGIVISRRVAPRFPLASFILIHDDTTILGPIAVSASDEFNGSRSPRPRAPTERDDPSVTCYLADAVLCLAEAVLANLDLVLETTKLHLFHPSIPSQPSLAAALAHRFPQPITLEPLFYVVGGLPIGTADGIAAFLSNLASEYESTLAWFTSIPDVRRHAAALILLLCLRPNSLFNHHLRGTPPSFTLATAHRLRHAIITAFAKATAIAASSFLTPSAGDATTLQLLTAVSAGGVGLSGPVTLAAPAFLASFADSLPALSTDPFLAPFLADRSSWHSSPSPILRDAALAFTSLTRLPPLLDRVLLSRLDDSTTSAVSSLLDSSGRPSLDRLHLAAGLHLQALLFTALSTAARDAALPTLSTLARARFHISSAYGSGALLLAFNISTADFLIDVHFTFYLTHRLGLPHPTRSAAALSVCSRRCPRVKHSDPMVGQHPLAYGAPHGFHQLSCVVTSSRIDRLNNRTYVLKKHLDMTKIYYSAAS